MVNWISLVNLASRVPNLFSETDGRPFQQYDWRLGVFQYVIGLGVTFIALTSTDGSNLALLSKMSPQRLRGVVINVGTLSTFLSLIARMAADLQILAVDLSHKLINTDIVNALVVPLILLALVLLHFVRKHFYFLM